MEIQSLVKKPELVEVKIDDADVIEAYGEEITFWMRDFVDISTYFDFYRSQSDNDGAKLNSILKRIILNKDGKAVMTDDTELPVDVTIALLLKVNEVLGKSKTRSST